MSRLRSAPRRQGPRTLRRIGPVVITLVRAVHARQHDQVTVTVSEAAASAIARAAARRDAAIGVAGLHPAHSAAREPVEIARATAEQWCHDAWLAVRDGQLPIADAQALSDQLHDPGAA